MNKSDILNFILSSPKPVTKREVSDAFASSLPANYVGGNISVGALPALSISRTDDALTLVWPGWATNFVAQEAFSRDAATMSFTNILASPVLTNGQNVLLLPVHNSTRFFRLQRGQ